MGSRTHLRHDASGKTGEPIDPATRIYVVAGWASVNEDTEGPAIWDVVENHLHQESRAAGDPLITEVQDWNQYLGDGVDANLTVRRPNSKRMLCAAMCRG
jgi:hypothetical protein